MAIQDSGNSEIVKILKKDAVRRNSPLRVFPDYATLKYLKIALAQALSRTKPDVPVVADVGCGSRPYDGLLRQIASEVIGIDLAGNPLADRCFAVGEALPLSDESVDLVVNFQVLEHVPQTKEFLREIHRVLKPDGMLVLSTHGLWPYHPCPGDYYRWTQEGLKLVIEESGFVVEEVISVLPGWAASIQFQLSLLHQTFWKSRITRVPVLIIAWLASWLIDALVVMPLPGNEMAAAVYLVVARKGKTG